MRHYLKKFLSNFDAVNDACWLWQGYVQKEKRGNGGYGIYGRNLAHRVSYEVFREPIPQGLQLDHLCRVRYCVNPWHLEVVTNRENCRRGIATIVNTARARAKTHCKYGHEYTVANTYLQLNHKGTDWVRFCRACTLKRRHEEFLKRRRLSHLEAEMR